MTRVKEFVQKHPVIVFVFLAYTITWASWAPLSYGYDRGLIEMTPGITFLYIAGSFGPLLAGAVATYLLGGQPACLVRTGRQCVLYAWHKGQRGEGEIDK